MSSLARPAALLEAVQGRCSAPAAWPWAYAKAERVSMMTVPGAAQYGPTSAGGTIIGSGPGRAAAAVHMAGGV